MNDIVFKRKIYAQMLQWKQESKGETALLIEGARRVGKSTIVKQFAQQEYKSFVIFDFAKASKAEKELFDDISDLDFFFAQLKVIKNVNLYERESVIIFDEVQKYPIARQAIKYLVADGRYDYIETGSLISIHRNVDDIVIPSEEESISMYPMDYEEFRWALGDEVSIPLIRQTFAEKRGFGDAVNRKLMKDFRLYMLIGGMPQAVKKYIDTHDFGKVDKTKRAIIKLYLQDFHKLDKSDKAQLIFNAIPAQLSNNSNRYQITTVVGNKSDSLQEIIAMMEDSKTIYVAYHANDPNVGQDLHSDKSTYKIYLADTGLFVTLAFWDKAFTENIIYQKLLNDDLSANLGYVYENMVAQILATSGNRLFYYTFPTEDKHLYEVDFLLSHGSKICPIEVKSSGYKTHASLDAFCTKYSSRVGERYLIYTKDLRKDGTVWLLPIYMTELL